APPARRQSTRVIPRSRAMKCFAIFQKLFGRAPVKSTKGSRRVRLDVEALETRLTPSLTLYEGFNYAPGKLSGQGGNANGFANSWALGSYDNNVASPGTIYTQNDGGLQQIGGKVVTTPGSLYQSSKPYNDIRPFSTIDLTQSDVWIGFVGARD